MLDDVFENQNSHDDEDEEGFRKKGITRQNGAYQIWNPHLLQYHHHLVKRNSSCLMDSRDGITRSKSVSNRLTEWKLIW
ncbi:hypothetical protein AAHA92_15692 [Salvia divinorum]|uniref:Uncharacterized protein n=1 Tax=Salvia divinorum TaxID=28513 RepID=A0ABD1HFI8_SALDI